MIRLPTWCFAIFTINSITKIILFLHWMIHFVGLQRGAKPTTSLGGTMARVIESFLHECETVKEIQELSEPWRELAFWLGFRYSLFSMRTSYEYTGKTQWLTPRVLNNTSPEFSKRLLQMNNRANMQGRLMRTNPAIKAIVSRNDHTLWSPNTSDNTVEVRELYQGTDHGWAITLPFYHEEMTGALVFVVSEKISESVFKHLVAHRLKLLKDLRARMFYTLITRGVGAPENPLSMLQRQILQLYSQGAMRPAIVGKLNIKERTVRTESQKIFTLLNAENATHAVFIASKLKYI